MDAKEQENKLKVGPFGLLSITLKCGSVAIVVLVGTASTQTCYEVKEVNRYLIN